MSTGEDDSRDERLNALDARMKVIEGSLEEILLKVREACEAAGIAAASAPLQKRRRHLTVVKGLLVGGAAWAGLRKLLAGTAIAGVLTAGAVTALSVLPARSPVAPPPAAAAPAPAAAPVAPVHAAAPAARLPRHHHHGAVVLAAAGSAPASQSPAPLVSVSPSPSGSGSVNVKVPVPLPSPLSSPACVNLPLLPGICVGL